MRAATVVVFCLLLTGCFQTLQQVSQSDADPRLLARIEQIKSIDAWALQGRISVRHDQERVSFKVKWRQQKNGEYNIEFVAPMGQGWMRVNGDARKVVVETSDNRIFEGKSIEDVARKVTGWELPLASLKYWMFGVPVPEKEYSVQMDDSGRVSSLSQNRWKIDYLVYGEQGGYQVPAKFRALSEPFEIKAVIKSWEIETDAEE